MFICHTNCSSLVLLGVSRPTRLRVSMVAKNLVIHKEFANIANMMLANLETHTDRLGLKSEKGK